MNVLRYDNGVEATVSDEHVRLFPLGRDEGLYWHERVRGGPHYDMSGTLPAGLGEEAHAVVRESIQVANAIAHLTRKRVHVTIGNVPLSGEFEGEVNRGYFERHVTPNGHIGADDYHADIARQVLERIEQN